MTLAEISRSTSLQMSLVMPEISEASSEIGTAGSRGGEDFHSRYLLTDKGGIRIDAGFSAEGDHQTTDMA